MRQDKVALYLHNGPEYLQSAFACMNRKARPRPRSPAAAPRMMGAPVAPPDRSFAASLTTDRS